MAVNNDYTYNFLSFFGYQFAKKVMDTFWDTADRLGADRNPYRAGFAQQICVAETDEQAEELMNVLQRRLAEHAATAAALLESLAHPPRLAVPCRLVVGEAPVSALEATGTLSMSALSQHLAMLREAGLVRTRREAQSIYYALEPGPVLPAAYCAPGRAH